MSSLTFNITSCTEFNNILRNKSLCFINFNYWRWLLSRSKFLISRYTQEWTPSRVVSPSAVIISEWYHYSLTLSDEWLLYHHDRQEFAEFWRWKHQSFEIVYCNKPAPDTPQCLLSLFLQFYLPVRFSGIQLKCSGNGRRMTQFCKRLGKWAVRHQRHKTARCMQTHYWAARCVVLCCGYVRYQPSAFFLSFLGSETLTESLY